MQRRDPRHDILFEPVQIGPKRLRNRFYQVPHCSGFGEVKPFSQAEHRATKAEGGWAAVSTEYAPVSIESDESPAVGARMWDSDDAANLGVMCARAHEYGSLAAIELNHSGGHAMCGEARVPSIAPSQLASDYIHHIVPKRMDLDDIARIRRDWVEAAKRARDVGFDIVYVYGGHSYLPMQFLSGFYNHRTDGYGGSFERRARFWLELLTDVREAVGTTAPSPTGSPSPRSGRRASSSTSRSASSRPPTTSSTCGTSTSGRSASGRRTRELHVSSGRATNWNGPEG